MTNDMQKQTRNSNVDSVTIERVVHVESIFGKGVEGDPVRVIHEYYTMDGKLIVRHDTYLDTEPSAL